MKKLLLIIGLQIFITPLALADFSDVSADHPYSEAINWAQENNIVNGFPDGTFRPDQKINRAELTKIIIEANFEDAEISGDNCFSDVKDEWFAKYICTAKREGIVKGYEGRSFKPGNKIRFNEASKIITLSMGLNLEEEEYSWNWYFNYSKYLGDNKAIPTSILRTDSYLARSEFVEIIWRLKEKPENKDFSYSKGGSISYKYKSGKIYFDDRKMQEIMDPDSFVILGNYYTKDKYFVYYNGKKINGSHSDSFVMLKGYYSKDRHFVYYDTEKIKGAHSDSFIALDNSYAKDKDFVYHDAEKIKEADPDSFVILEQHFYAKDKNFVYCFGDKIEGADPISFKTLDNQYYTKDENFVYFRKKKIESADPISFNLLDDGYHAKDKDNCYKFGKIVSKSECK